MATTITDSAPNKADWKSEIHTPEAEYNANVPLDAIERDPTNRVPAAEAVAELAKSVDTIGLLQPIVLQAIGGGKYRLMAGETRWRAYQELKRKTIPARIYKDQSAVSAATKALAENAQRTDLTPIERAKRFKQLEDLKVPQKEIGRLAGGISQPVVANAIRMLELPDMVQTLVDCGDLSEAHGVVLVKWARWPRVCTCIADTAREYGWTAKTLAQQEGFPCPDVLERAKLIVRINTGSKYAGPIYTLPRHFKSHRDFVVGEYTSYYVLPEDAKDNVWQPEKERQDVERAKEEEAAKAREAKKLAKQGGKTAEQIERQKTLEKNKRQRAENGEALRLAVDKLKRTPTPTTLLVAIIAERAISGGGFGDKRLQAAADLVQVALPAGVISGNGGHGLRNVPALCKMDAGDLARFAVAVLLVKDTDDANRNAWKVPANVERVMNAAVPENFGVGDLVEWESGGKMKRGTVLTAAEYEKATGTKWAAGAHSKAYVPVRLQNPDTLDCPYNGILRTGLRVVKAGAPADLIKVDPAPKGASKAAKAKAKKGGAK